MLNDPVNLIDPYGLQMYRNGYITKPLGQQLREFGKVLEPLFVDKRTEAEKEAARQDYYKDLQKRLGQAAGAGIIYGKAEKIVWQPVYLYSEWLFGHVIGSEEEYPPLWPPFSPPVNKEPCK